MKRRDFFKWIGIGAAVAGIPAPVRKFVKAILPASIKRRLRTHVIIDVLGRGDAQTIQEGMNMLSPQGGQLHLVPGVYFIKKPVKLRSDVAIHGNGAVIDIGDDDIAALDMHGSRCLISGLQIRSSEGRKGFSLVRERPQASENVITGNTVSGGSLIS